MLLSNLNELPKSNAINEKYVFILNGIYVGFVNHVLQYGDSAKSRHLARTIYMCRDGRY